VVICLTCWLVQLDGGAAPEAQHVLADPFAVSDTMRTHARQFVDDVLRTSALPRNGSVVEVASHGGHLHRFFAERSVPTIVLEPAPEIAERVRVEGSVAMPLQLGRDSAELVERLGRRVDVLVDAFLLAHVPQLDAFLRDVSSLLAPGGAFILQFDHLLPLVSMGRYDSFRHGHYVYLSLTTLRRSLERHGLEAVHASGHDVYGGVLRVVARRAEDSPEIHSSVHAVLDAEHEAGLESPAALTSLADRAVENRARLRALVAEVRRGGHTVVAYGAPSRGNTLLNYAGLTVHDLPYTVDISAAKQGRFMPGSRLPIYNPTRIADTRPDYVLILPWDLRSEIERALAFVAEWGGKFVLPLPEVSVEEA
jgi:C-methyltransferase-like protein/methyltransferase family protein